MNQQQKIPRKISRNITYMRGKNFTAGFQTSMIADKNVEFPFGLPALINFEAHVLNQETKNLLHSIGYFRSNAH